MSRVHEALARAQGTGADAPTPADPDHSGVPLFPIEGPETLWAAESPQAQQPADPSVMEPSVPVQSGEVVHATGHAPARTDEPSVLADPVRRLAEKLVLSPDPNHESVEQYRRLAARLHLAQAEHGIKVVMVASALPGEGKTLTATNLALTLSESYHRNVLLVDGDLRRPAIHELFRVPNVSGLNEGLHADADRKVPLVRWSDHLTLITAGRPAADPMKVLISPKMRKVLSEASEKFEWVIIDTPPVGLLTDASLFSAMVDTAVLVVQAGRTPHADIQRAIQALGRDRIFGVVLNRAASATQAGYGYGYRYIASPSV